MVKTLTILGATGSVGTSTLDLVRRNRDKFAIDTLTAHSQVQELALLAREFNAKCAVISPPFYNALKSALSGTKTQVSSDLCEAARRPVGLTIAAITGIAGLAPVLATLEAGNALALANKESLVAGGDLVMRLAAQKNISILPMDSEHNALFQSLGANALADVETMFLTASGGPFRTWSVEKLARATLKDALKHPNWAMGAKITIDSASLMNKGLELIEAHYLFALPHHQLKVIVHPQSVIHGLVSFKDGSFIAQMGAPDMRIPIASCLAHPHRLASPVERLDLIKLSRLEFEAPDLTRFPCLQLAMEALKTGDVAPLVLNAANEKAVENFQQQKISFAQIATKVATALEAFAHRPAPQSLEGVLAMDAEVKRFTAHA